MKRPARVLLSLLPISLSGVLVGHFLVYKWLFPPSNHLHADSADQHRYLPAFVVLSIVLALVSLVGYVFLGYRERKNHSSTQTKVSYLKTVTILFLVQSVTFIAMELLEQGHAINLHSSFEFFSSQLFVIGVLFQLFTAALVALSIFTANAIGRHIGAYSRPVNRPQRLTSLFQAYIAWGLNERITNRGPPATF